MIEWLNTNSAAVQALSTVVLVLVTIWYAIRTHSLASIAEKQFRRSIEPDILVTASWGVTAPDFVDVIILTAANRGQLGVTLDSPVLALPDGKTLSFITGFAIASDHFPRRLEPGDACSGRTTIGVVARGYLDAGYRGRVDVKVRFTDQAGRRYESKSVSLDLEKNAGKP